ncbi:hypothetical protein IQ63_38165 [Streptomyces acidiscabies]|uniref:Transposase n=1 Tax=Streptomyces acidiscabies TaxID=42234 RepID=A0A0L0JL23_9ACTN|nr:hypothetical protein IQ63_38165 [Streptomyces acidiscabies]
MCDGDGLFEVEPEGKKRPQGPPAAVGKTFRAFDPHQVMLLPPSLDDWLPGGHLARFVADLVDEVLDLSPVLAGYTESAATRPTTSRSGSWPPVRNRTSARSPGSAAATSMRSPVQGLLADAEAADEAEDHTFGVDGKKADLPAELDRREKRLAKLQAARAQIEAEATEKARAHADKERRRQERAGTSDELTVTDAGDQAADKARPKPKAQANFTDPDSRIMKNSDGACIQAYNAQAVADEEHSETNLEAARERQLACRQDGDRSHRSRPAGRLLVTKTRS